MQDQDRTIFTELITLKTTVELGFKNVLDRFDQMASKVAAHEVKIDGLEKSQVQLGGIIDSVKEAGNERQRNADVAHESFVTKDQFWPVKTLVYGFVGLILVAVIGGLVALVVKQ